MYYLQPRSTEYHSASSSNFQPNELIHLIIRPCLSLPVIGNYRRGEESREQCRQLYTVGGCCEYYSRWTATRFNKYHSRSAKAEKLIATRSQAAVSSGARPEGSAKFVRCTSPFPFLLRFRAKIFVMRKIANEENDIVSIRYDPSRPWRNRWMVPFAKCH